MTTSMKLHKGDKVMVISGRDHGKTGEILAVFPKTGQIVVQGANIVKRHVKPSQKEPKGGIIPTERPLQASRVMAIDPASGKPARIGYKIGDKGQKTRVFKVSKFTNKKVAKPAAPKSGATDKTKADKTTKSETKS